VVGFWTNYKVHLKDSLGGPFGGTYRWNNPKDVATFNIMAASSAYTYNVLGMMYDGLLNIGPDGVDIPDTHGSLSTSFRTRPGVMECR
jgi:ABC-type oligopeptide transport system substrate-binding subunit